MKKKKRTVAGRVRIRRARLSKGLSQRELGDLCGVGNVTICRIEKGYVSRPTIKTLKAIAKALRVPLAEIA